MQECHEGSLRKILATYPLSQVLLSMELFYRAEAIESPKTTTRLDALLSCKSGVSALRQIIDKIESDSRCCTSLTPAVSNDQQTRDDY